MRKLVLFSCMQLAFLSFLNANGCPSPIAPLPQVPVPAVVPPPVATCPTPTPATVTGYMPFTFVNNTGLPASEIYICVLVNSTTQYLTFTHTGGHYLASISSFSPTTYLSTPQYSTPLSSFENIATNTYTFYIPNDGNTAVPGSNVMKSSRILVSLKSPLSYFINHYGSLQIPNEFDTTNDNYYVLNDKVEYDIGSNGFNRMNLNLTWVDFFGLPFLVQTNYQFFYGTSYTAACSVTGMPSSVTMNGIFTQYNNALNTLASPFNGYWEGLIATYTNPAGGGGANCNLRIYAPATAMGSTQTTTNPSSVTFPINYFLSTAISPNSCSWFDAVWSGTTLSGATAFYQGTTPVPYLILDATTKGGAGIATGYEVNDGSFRFEISGGADDGKDMTFPFPTSTKAFFTGAVSDYEPAISSNASAASQDQLLKVFATSIIAGFFPINCKTNPPIEITSIYMQNHSANYFQNNSTLTTALSGCSCLPNVPWFDFYSRTLLTIGSPNLFYTSAYSDFLTTDGTIVVVDLQNHNAAATVTVNLGDCSTGVNYPNPYSDTTTYTITVGIPANATVLYGPSATGPWTSTIPSSVQGNQFFLKVTYTGGIYNGTTAVTQIAPAVQVFHPILPAQGQITTHGTTTYVGIGASPAS